jgi:hypothetical protein
MTHDSNAPGICALCRAFGRFKLRVADIKETPDPSGEREELFTTGCWIIVALERTRQCPAHLRTLRSAKRLAEELARLVEEEKEGRWIRK